MYCKNCGKKLSEDSLFCTSCGEHVEPETYIDQTTWTYSDEYSDINDYQPERRRLTPGARAVILIIIVAIAILVIKDIGNSDIKLGHQKVYSVQVKYGKLGEDVTVSEYVDGKLINVEFVNPIYAILAGGNPEDVARVYINNAKEKNMADIYKFNGQVY